MALPAMPRIDEKEMNPSRIYRLLSRKPNLTIKEVGWELGISDKYAGVKLRQAVDRGLVIHDNHRPKQFRVVE